ncbi:MAG: hypothetical protein WDN48_18175 [Pseudolabrys sp.]
MNAAVPRSLVEAFYRAHAARDAKAVAEFHVPDSAADGGRAAETGDLIAV